MENLIKTRVMPFVLLFLVAFSNIAKADLYKMVFTEAPAINVSYVWDGATDEISDFTTVFTPTSSVFAYEITDEPSLLGDNIDGAFSNVLGDFTFEGSLSDVFFDSLTNVYVHQYFTEVYDLNDNFVRDFTTVFIGAPVSAVPVPAALPLMASALGLFGIARRRNL